jgi:diguanylate cyclase (GGDEF)-like protein
MNLRIFYAELLFVLAAVVALSLTWEFWLEDWLLPSLVSYHEKESSENRWEFVVTSASFAAIALIVPAILGTQIIRRDQVLRLKMIRLSQEDHLTGLFNRRRIYELLESEIQRAARYSTEFSVILMDIDNFKSINDRLGHQAGDEALTKIAEVIRLSVRATDLLGRWGGEEFIIILPETNIGGCFSLAEKIRTRLESADLGEIGHRTASLGVTAFAEGDDLEAVIARADGALYAAKQGGRNRTVKGPPGSEAGLGSPATAG